MDKSNLVHLTENTFKSEVITHEGLVLVDFWAEWCGPCRIIGPIVEELSREYSGKLHVCKLDVEKHGSIAQQYNIQSIPTLIFFKDGKEIQRSIGAKSMAELKQIIDNLLE